MVNIFEATIKKNQGGGALDWYIELRDTSSGQIEICKDLKEFSQKVEEMGQAYNGMIDEVRWSKDEDIHPLVIDNIRLEMIEIQKEIEQERGGESIYNNEN